MEQTPVSSSALIWPNPTLSQGCLSVKDSFFQGVGKVSLKMPGEQPEMPLRGQGQPELSLFLSGSNLPVFLGSLGGS